MTGLFRVLFASASLVFVSSGCSAKTDTPEQQGSNEGSGSTGGGTTGSPAASGRQTVESGSTGSSGKTGASGEVTSGASATGESGAKGESGATSSGRLSSSGATSGTSESGAASGAETGDDDATTSEPPPMCPGPEAGANPPRSDGGVSACGSAKGPTTIFSQSCENGICHNAMWHQYALDLQSANVASRLVNVASLELPCYKLIDPEYPDQSYLLLKVMENPPAGGQMPSGGGMLSDTSIACLKEWVEAEAATASP